MIITVLLAAAAWLLLARASVRHGAARVCLFCHVAHRRRRRLSLLSALLTGLRGWNDLERRGWGGMRIVASRPSRRTAFAAGAGPRGRRARTPTFAAIVSSRCRVRSSWHGGRLLVRFSGRATERRAPAALLGLRLLSPGVFGVALRSTSFEPPGPMRGPLEHCRAGDDWLRNRRRDRPTTGRRAPSRTMVRCRS